MRNYLNNLKTKPDHIKRRFAFLISFSFTSLIFIGWIASYGFQSTATLADVNNENKVVVDAPVSSLTASVVGAYDDIKSVIFGSNKVEYSVAEVQVTAGER
jgi:hypothetical protein